MLIDLFHLNIMHHPMKSFYIAITLSVIKWCDHRILLRSSNAFFFILLIFSIILINTPFLYATYNLINSLLSGVNNICSITISFILEYLPFFIRIFESKISLCVSCYLINFKPDRWFVPAIASTKLNRLLWQSSVGSSLYS